MREPKRDEYLGQAPQPSEMPFLLGGKGTVTLTTVVPQGLLVQEIT